MTKKHQRSQKTEKTKNKKKLPSDFWRRQHPEI